MNHQVFERIERQLLASPRLHLFRNTGSLERVRIARVVLILLLVVVSPG